MILVLKTNLLSNIKLIWNQDTYGIGGGYKKPDSANWYVTQHRYYAYLNQRFTISNNYLSLGRTVLKIRSGHNYGFDSKLWNSDELKLPGHGLLNCTKGIRNTIIFAIMTSVICDHELSCTYEIILAYHACFSGKRSIRLLTSLFIHLRI